MNYTKRYIAHIVVEAETPIAVGSGEKGLDTDRLVAKDVNGLPYIPGTGLTGVLRHALSNNEWIDDVFGSGGKEGQGSRLIVSSAFIIGEDGSTIMEGVRNVDLSKGFYSYFNRLPERDHVRINHKGVSDSENHGKFDEELVHKGTRFCFELELKAQKDDADRASWIDILSEISSPSFRIGAGTRKGFGQLKVIHELSKVVEWDLETEKDLMNYLKKSGSLNDELVESRCLEIDKQQSHRWVKYKIELSPKDFFVFSAGFGDEDADNQPKKEKFFEWSSGRPKLCSQDYLLIPATSIKGALAHRVAYHYNQLKGNFIGDTASELKTQLDIDAIEKCLLTEFNIDNLDYSYNSSEWESMQTKIEQLSLEDIQQWQNYIVNIENEIKSKKQSVLYAGENNDAVKKLFGYAQNLEDQMSGQRGNVIINDVFIAQKNHSEKVFNHTKIDRFTNGTIDGALFQEKVSYYQEKISIEIFVDDTAWNSDPTIKDAFEATLDDLKTGRLALGGSTNKGHGIFLNQSN